jgi:ligand-binding sensor domain-containing protein
MDIRPLLAIFIFAGLSFNIDGLAQQIQKRLNFKHIKANSQLSELTITAIFQDSKGFLWIGTHDGLNRFDGYDVKIYRNIENDSTSLLENEILSIFEDSRGTLWVSTLNSGFHYYNRAAESFNRILEFSHQENCQIWRIIEDSNNNVWICGSLNSHAFVATLDPQTGKWKKSVLFSAKEGIYSMLQYSENEFWLGSRLDGLFKWNRKTNDLEQYLHDPNNSNSLPGNFINELAKDSFGNLWVGTRDSGLCKFNIKEKTFKNFKTQPIGTITTIPSNTIMDLTIDGHYLWIATENGGLSKIDTRNDVLTNYLHKKNDANSIINNSIWALHKDRQGRLWVGSYAAGLCVYDPLEDKISVSDLPLENELVNAIVKDSKGRMWVGTEDGLVLQDKAGIHHFRFDPDNNTGISSNAITCIYEDSKHRIWIGYFAGGVNRFEEKSQTFIQYLHNPKRKGSLSNADVFAITESSKTGELLLSTLGGLNILKDEKAGIFENNFQYSRSTDQYHNTLFEDSKQNIWVGAYGGLSQYSLENNIVKRINISNDIAKVSDHVNCIFEDHNGILWIGSNGGLH